MSTPKGRYAAIVYCFLSACGSASAADWPQFRGPGGAGFSNEIGLPTKWSKTENLRWVADLPGRGLSCPVIAKGKVYVTACTGFQQDRLHVLCFDAATGKMLWQRQFWATGTTVCHQKTCMAAPTPTTDGERVFALFATADLVALDAEGNLLWYRSLVRDYPTVGNNVGMASSPVVGKDAVLIAMENAGESFAVAIDKLTGKNRWKIDRHRGINWTTPLVRGSGEQAEIIFQSPKDVAAYDQATGKKRWSFEGEGRSFSTSPSPIPGNDLVLLAGGGKMMAIKPGPGDPQLVWESNKLKTGYASALFYQNRVYTVSAPTVNCVDGTDGKLLWTERVKGAYSASPVAADGKLYVVSEEGATTVIQLGDKPQILNVNEVGETILATPSIADGAIYLRSDQHLWCIGK